jgi:hypothetical protein
MASPATFLTRRQVAALLGTTEAEVKSQDNAVFHPVKGPDGSWRYPPDEVSGVLRGVIAGHDAVQPPGAVCAAAFELFQKDTKLPNVVIALKKSPALVRSLRAEYDAMAASLTVAPETLARLERIVRAPIRDEGRLVTLIENLGGRVRDEYERGYGAGLDEAQDAGEIVDLETGEKRRLDSAEIATRAKEAEERWSEDSSRFIAYAAKFGIFSTLPTNIAGCTSSYRSSTPLPTIARVPKRMFSWPGNRPSMG